MSQNQVTDHFNCLCTEPTSRAVRHNFFTKQGRIEREGKVEWRKQDLVGWGEGHTHVYVCACVRARAWDLRMTGCDIPTVDSRLPSCLPASKVVNSPPASQPASLPACDLMGSRRSILQWEATVALSCTIIASSVPVLQELVRSLPTKAARPTLHNIGQDFTLSTTNQSAELFPSLIQSL